VSRILLEDTFDFKPDRQRITESKDPVTGLTTKKVPGTLSVCDCVNGNKRRYGKRVWEKNLTPGSPLTEMFKRRASFGLLEHPKDGKVDLTSPISHITTEASLVEKEIDGKKMWVVEGIIEIVDTVDGKKLTALIQAGYDPLVSSRGYGTLVPTAEGVDDVQEDYICEGWDVVSAPSFTQAQLAPSRPTETKVAETKTVKESKRAPAVGELYNGLIVIASKRISEQSAEITLEDGSPIVITMESVSPKLPQKEQPISAPAPSSIKATNQQPPRHMDINTIKESIRSLRNVVPSTLDARSFASGFAQMSELHNAAAKHLSENATASWEVGQLHKDISTIEEAWTTAFNAPRAQVVKLTEDNNKLLKVVKGITSYAVKVKDTLTETAKKNGKINEVTTALASRGRSWADAAGREVTKRKLSEKKYTFACEALDIMAAKYKTDVAKIGARVLELEFPTMTEEQKKALSEAKTPKAIVAVRALIEKKEAPAADPKKVVEAKKDPVVADPKKIDESKKDPVVATDPKKVDDVKIFRQDTAVVGIGESIGMIRRLSQNQPQFHS
jgi:Prohead core protein serine protease